MRRIFRARWVLPIAGEPIEEGAVVVEEGAVAAVGPRRWIAAEATAGAPLVDLGEVALLPGFVNVHAHLELTLLRGHLEERDFFRWIRRLTEAKHERLAPEDIALSARLGLLEAVRSGVTCVGEVCDLGESVGALQESGLRGVAYQEVLAPDPRDAKRALGELEERLAARREKVKGSRVALGVSPHAAYTVSEPLLEGVVRLAHEERLPLSMHAAESRAERELVERGEGPFARFLRARGIEREPTGLSPIAWLERCGVLETRPLLAHCVDSPDVDRERLAAAGARVAHCPRSNLKLGHGAAPLGGWLSRGIPVGVGTDSVASNNRFDVLEEARLAALLARRPDARGGPAWLGGREVLRLATRGGAEALGLGGEVGTIEPGKRADLVAIDLSGAHLAPIHGIEETLAWSASGRDVVWTMVDGEVLHDRGALARLGEGEEEAIRREANEIARRKLSRAEPGAS